MVNYQCESHCVYRVVYHTIWCQIRWRKVLVGPIHYRIQEIIEQVIEENAWKLLKLAIQADHVHLFVRANPYTLPADIARKIKGRSSHLLREASKNRSRSGLISAPTESDLKKWAIAFPISLLTPPRWLISFAGEHFTSLTIRPMPSFWMEKQQKTI